MKLKYGMKLATTLVACSLAFAACTSATPGGTTPGTAGESSSSTSTKKLRMGVTFPILDQWLQKLADGMKAKADSLGIELSVVSAEEKADVQLSQVENFVSQGFDAIMVIPQDTDASAPITQAAQGANIPLIFVAKNPADRPDGVPYIGSDSIVAGTMQMEALAKLAGGKGNVVILQGDPSQETARDRTKGCKDVIAKNPGMKVTKEQAGNWYRDKGQSIMENWLQSGDQIDVVCANNDEMALGAINAIKADGKKLGEGGILVGGVDATSDALAAMASGDLAVTIFQDAAGQGTAAIEAAVKLVNGEKVDDITFVPYQLVTPDNMKDFQ